MLNKLRPFHSFTATVLAFVFEWAHEKVHEAFGPDVRVAVIVWREGDPNSVAHMTDATREEFTEVIRLKCAKSGNGDAHG